MPNIFETVLDLDNTRNAKITMLQSRKGLSLSASASKGSSENFRLIKVDLSKLPSILAGKADGPIVVDLNVDKIHRTGSGYIPKTVVLAGGSAFQKAKRLGELYCDAWIGDKVLAKLNIHADGISSNDLSDKVRTLISAAYTKQTKNSYSDGTYAYVVDIFPFDNYCVFSLGKDKFRQNFKLDEVNQEVSLDGKPVKVIEQYVLAPTDEKKKGITASSLMQTESLVDRINNGPVLGALVGPATSLDSDTIVNYGAPGSEANNPMLRLMLNVEEALAMYLTEVATGIHKVVQTPFAAIPAGLVVQAKEAKIAATAAEIDLDRFSIMDFMKWQDKHMRASIFDRRKIIAGQKLVAKDFACVGDPGDPSTWQLPMHTMQAAAQSLVDVILVPKTYRKSSILKLESVLAEEEKKKRDGGPHLGKGKPAAGKIKELQTKLKDALDKHSGTVKAGGPGSGRKPGDILKGFGFKKGNSIVQSPTNQIHIFHGKGPGGANQQVMLSGPAGKTQTFTHVSNPATSDAVVHARQQPVSGLQDHMFKHWVNHVTNKSI